MPFQEAPGHFECDSDGHCFVCKQPSTPEEVDRMVSAVWVSEVSCIRYTGNDPETLRKLIAVKAQDQCDVLQEESKHQANSRKIWWAIWLG